MTSPVVTKCIAGLMATVGSFAGLPDAGAQINGRSSQYQQRNFQNHARASQAQRTAGVSGARVTGGGAARPVAAGASLRGMQTALNAFAMDMGRMPTAAEGLSALTQRPLGAKNWRGPYISTNNWRAPFTDPWGSQYRYVVQGAGRQAIHYIISNGPDRSPGTRDDLSVQF